MKSTPPKKTATKSAAKKPEARNAGQDRVKQEKKDLDLMRLALNKSIVGDSATEISAAEAGRLLDQAEAMTDYSAILDRRIDAFD